MAAPSAAARARAPARSHEARTPAEARTDLSRARQRAQRRVHGRTTRALRTASDTGGAHREQAATESDSLRRVRGVGRAWDLPAPCPRAWAEDRSRAAHPPHPLR